METKNERNFRILEKRFEIEEEMESLITAYGNEFVCVDTNEDDVKLYVMNGNEPIRIFENEQLHLIRNESPSWIGIGVGDRLENEPYKLFENEIWFENRNRFRNGFRNELGNENENRNENENENELGNGNGNGLIDMLHYSYNQIKKLL